MKSPSIAMIVAAKNQILFDKFCRNKTYDQVRNLSERAGCDLARVEEMIRRNEQGESK